MSSKNFSFPKVIGHRGACGYAPENTLVSMYKAHQLGVHWVEFDVMLTQDQQAIIMHDETLNRTTNGRGKVAATDYATIAALDAGGWFAPEFAAEPVPTFAGLLNYLAELKLNINVEIKPTMGAEIATAEQTIKILKKHWIELDFATPLVSSGSILSLQTARKMDDELLLGFITDEWLDNWETILTDLNCISLHINHRKLNQKKVAVVKQKGYGLLAYTVNDPKRAQELFDWGVDGVFTDFPDKILANVI